MDRHTINKVADSIKESQLLPKGKPPGQEVDGIQLKALIAVAYNLLLIVLWFYYDYMVFYETYRFGFARVMNRPDKYLTGSHIALKVVQTA